MKKIVDQYWIENGIAVYKAKYQKNYLIKFLINNFFTVDIDD